MAWPAASLDLVYLQISMVTGYSRQIRGLFGFTGSFPGGAAMERKWARRCAAGAVAVATAGLVLAAVADAAVVQPHVTPTWQTNGRVETIRVVGATAYIGGKFTSVRPAGAAPGTGEVTRNGAAAIDLTNGSVLPWNPNVNGTVMTLVVSGKTVVLGGSFTKVGNQTHDRLAAVATVTGAPIAGWNASANKEVAELAAHNGTVYAGGYFTTVNGASHNYLAAVSLANGATVGGWHGAADAPVLAVHLANNAGELVVGGTFSHLDGGSQNHIGALSPATGAAMPWSTHTAYGVIDLAADANGVYVAGAGGGGNFAAFGFTGHMLWQGGTNGNVQAITVLNGIVYPGGHYTTYCGPQGGQHTCTTPTVRNKILGVDETNGHLEPWAPSVNSVLGIFAMGSGDDALEIGGDFTKVAGANQQGFAMFES
jgi:hypothetical protein